MGSLYGMVVEDHSGFVDDCGNKRWETINDTSQAPIKVIFELISYGEQFIQMFCLKLSMYQYLWKWKKAFPDKTVYNLVYTYVMNRFNVEHVTSLRFIVGVGKFDADITNFSK